MNQQINNKQLDFEKINRKVGNAISKLYQKDLHLFKVGVHERTVAHKLAEYLQQEFKGVWNVDCEYNRDKFETKMLESIISDEEERKEHRIFPDIIIHVRGNSGKVFNKLVIEIKTSGDSNAGDIQKLCGLTSPKHSFKYQYGLFIRFKSNFQGTIPLEQLILEKLWFQQGKEINYED